MATGRRANTDDLGLARIGVQLREDGTVQVDETLETSSPGVFAAGDVIGEPAFVYTAAYEGRLAAENALGTSKQPRDYRALPAVVFTDPEIAATGLTEDEAKAKGHGKLKVGKFPFAALGRALSVNDTEGFVKVVADGETGLVVAPRDVGAVRDALATLLGDEAQRAKMGEAARARAVEHFSYDLLVQRLAPIAAGVRRTDPELRVAYVMTDGAALPGGFSRLVAELRGAGLLHGWVTCGQAFGGELEAVTVWTGLLAARELLTADVAVVADGPGNLGTETTWGVSALGSGHAIVDDAEFRRRCRV